MGLFNRGKDEQHQKFQMREKLISIGDDYWIEDDDGDKVFKVNGKALRVRDTWELEDAERQHGRQDPGEEAHASATRSRSSSTADVRRP